MTSVKFSFLLVTLCLVSTTILTNKTATVEDEALTVLNYYIQFIKENHLQCQYKVGFSFCSDMDIVVDANKLLPGLGLTGEVEVDDSVKENDINSMEDFEKLMKYYMSSGIGEEKYIHNKETFEKILLETFKNKLFKDIGGNAMVMAQRAELEGCDVTIGARLNQDIVKKYYRNNVKIVDDTGERINDYHIIIRYYINDDFWNIKIPRSNRLFINRDVDNANMEELYNFMDYVDREKPQMVAISGFQLPVDPIIIEDRLTMLDKRLSTDQNKDLIVHVELAAFSNTALHHLFFSKFLHRVDSIGANEREMFELLEFLQEKMGGDHEAVKIKAKMDHSLLIRKMTEILNLIDVLGLRTSRLHIHTLTNHMVCFRKDTWRGGKFSVSKGIQVSLMVSGEYTNENFDKILENKENLNSNLPDEIVFDTMYGRVTKTKEDLLKKPVFSLHINEKWKCSVGVTVEVKIPKRIRGLGDNISGAGLVHHKLKKFFDVEDKVNEEEPKRKDTGELDL